MYGGEYYYVPTKSIDPLNILPFLLILQISHTLQNVDVIFVLTCLSLTLQVFFVCLSKNAKSYLFLVDF